MKTQKEIEVYEAKIAKAQEQVKQVKGNCYSVPSSTEPQPHIVMVDETGKVQYCSCKGWKYCGHCYHAIATERFITAQKAIAEAVEIVAQKPTSSAEYIRIANGGLVLKSAQERTAPRGTFSFLK